MMNGISKRIGSTLKWLWLPVVVYTTTLSVEARLIQTGASENTWDTWRCFLLLSLIILSYITYFLNTIVQGRGCRSCMRYSRSVGLVFSRHPAVCLSPVGIRPPARTLL